MKKTEVKKNHKARQFLIVGDPISTLRLETDTSLVICQEALKRGFSVDWCEAKDIGLLQNRPIISKYETILKIGSSVSTRAVSEFKNIDDYDDVVIRKDPPFDEEYKTLCWFLSLTKARVTNSPESLLLFHEKLFPAYLVSIGILELSDLVPTCMTGDKKIISSFLSEFPKGTRFITKPFLGFGGQGVSRFDNKTALIKGLTQKKDGRDKKENPYFSIIQPFLEDIYENGDTRVYLTNGRIFLFFTRFPQKGQIVANIAAGGIGVLQPLTTRQKVISEKIGLFLAEKNLRMAGLDFIGDKLSEVNVTSPTGIRTYEMLAKKSISALFFDSIFETPF